jgi:hypothetical protein
MPLADCGPATRAMPVDRADRLGRGSSSAHCMPQRPPVMAALALASGAALKRKAWCGLDGRWAATANPA